MEAETLEKEYHDACEATRQAAMKMSDAVDGEPMAVVIAGAILMIQFAVDTVDDDIRKAIVSDLNDLISRAESMNHKNQKVD
jgi:hypothetical protein